MNREKLDESLENLQRSIENAQNACAHALQVIESLRIEPESALYNDRMKKMIDELGGKTDGN